MKKYLDRTLRKFAGLKPIRMGKSILLVDVKQPISYVGEGVYLQDNHHPINQAGPYRVVYNSTNRQPAAHLSLTKYAWDEYIQEALNKYGINIVIDVGANVGQFGSHLRQDLNYRGKIFSFEPLASAFSELERTASGDKEWQIYNFALGSCNCHKTLHAATNSDLSSFLAPHDNLKEIFGEKANDTRDFEVEIRVLADIWDSVIGNIIEEPRVFLKMDTQGYDLEVFKGLGEKKTLVTLLQSELSALPIYDNMPHITEALKFYESSGFELMNLCPVNINHGNLRAIEFDCLLFNPAAPTLMGASK